MLNSRNYQSDSGVLNSGEEIVSSLEELNDPNAKTYYHQVKGAVTHLPDGAQITFSGGMFVTANPEIQAYLDKVANKRGSMVYTKNESRRQQQQEVRQAALAAMVNPGDQKGQDGVVDPTRAVSQDSLESNDPNSSKLITEKDVSHPEQEQKQVFNPEEIAAISQIASNPTHAQSPASAGQNAVQRAENVVKTNTAQSSNQSFVKTDKSDESVKDAMVKHTEAAKTSSTTPIVKK